MKDPTYYQTPIPPNDRPDGRASSPSIIRLRAATRALRLHLDKLPVDYNIDLGPAKFLAGISFNFARQRYSSAESLLGAGMGGVVLGGIARSLFVDGLRWSWVAEDPSNRHRRLLGDLLHERNNVCEIVRLTGTKAENLPRWLMPIPSIADLTGESLSWLEVPPLPSDDELLADFLTDREAGPEADSARDSMHLIGAASMRGVALVLAFAGHGNFLGLQSCLTEDGRPGHDLRDIYEALFMQAAAAGVVAVLNGTAATVPELWPQDVDKKSFLTEANALANDVAEAARPLHQLITTKSKKYSNRPLRAPKPVAVLNSQAIVHSSDVAPFTGNLTRTFAAAERFWRVSRFTPVRAEHFAAGTTLHESLNHGGAYSNLEAALATYDKPGSGLISVFAARMLLEEAARLHWRFSATDEAFKARATQFFDEFRSKKRKTINQLHGNGVPLVHAERLFSLPSFVDGGPSNPLAKNRTQPPSTRWMLEEFGSATQERDPGWLSTAYSLFSQVTHATTLGSLHTIAVDDNMNWRTNELSPEFLALSLDVTCMASAYLIGHSALILTGLSDESRIFRAQLLTAASRVHAAAHEVHGLG